MVENFRKLSQKSLVIQNTENLSLIVWKVVKTHVFTLAHLSNSDDDFVISKKAAKGKE
jgi:hypothetical protein